MDVFEGRISSSGFASGDRIVVGDWKKSPLGSFTNVMWAKPDGARVLLSPSQKHADYVSALYNFEEVHIVPIEVIRQSKSIEIKAPPLKFQIPLGDGIWITHSKTKMVYLNSGTMVCQGILRN